MRGAGKIRRYLHEKMVDKEVLVCGCVCMGVSYKRMMGSEKTSHRSWFFILVERDCP